MRIWGSVLIAVLAFSGLAHAFPNQQRASLALSLSQSTQFAISTDNTTLYLCYGNQFKTVDTGTFAQTVPQPFDISTDTTTYPGNFTGLIYFPSQSAVICPQDNGSAILYNLNNITGTPTILTIASGKQLGFGAADTVGGENIYVVDVTDNSVVQYSIPKNIATPISLVGALASNFTVNNIVFSPQSTSDASEIYLSTSAGTVVYFPLASPAPLTVTIDPTLSQQLMGIAPTPNRQTIYVVDKGNTTVNPITISNHSVPTNSAIDLTPNGILNQLLITSVTNPQNGVGTAIYGYVAGSSSQGISVFDTANGQVLDFVSGNTSTTDPLPVSGVGPMVASTDGYIYISAASGNIGVISDNPWVTVNSVTYSGGGSSSTALGVGGTATVNFQADEVGTYALRENGTIVSTSGTVITDAYGNTSGTVAAVSTAQNIYVPYDTNVAAFQEGANPSFIFVTDSAGNVGRIETSINVDTPPTAVTVLGSSFGNTRAYINFSALTQNDINYYSVYADTDPVAVTTKTAVAATVPQGSGTLTGTVPGLTNGTLYYLAIEAVDNGGNIGPRTSTLSNGSPITSTPEFTLGPAGYSGETGCSLIRRTGDTK